MSDGTVGAPVTLGFQTRVAQVLTDASTITLTIRKPDSTDEPAKTYAASQIIRDSIGTYHYDYTPTAPGRHIAYWISTGTAAAALDYPLDIESPFDVGLASFDDTKRYLNKSGASNVDDSELAEFLQAASELVTRWTGITGSAKTYTFPKNLRFNRQLILPDGPIAAVTTVQDSLGTIIDPSRYFVDRRTGALTYGSYLFATPGGIGPAAGGLGYWPDAITVTYTLGPVPAPVREAVMDLTADMWRSQRGVIGTSRFGMPTASSPRLNAIGNEMGGPQPRWETLLRDYMNLDAMA